MLKICWLVWIALLINEATCNLLFKFFLKQFLLNNNYINFKKVICVYQKQIVKNAFLQFIHVVGAYKM